MSEPHLPPLEPTDLEYFTTFLGRVVECFLALLVRCPSRVAYRARLQLLGDWIAAELDRAKEDV